MSDNNIINNPPFTTRDQIATAAMNGMLSHSTRYRALVRPPRTWHDALADEAYAIADAMLKARNAKD